MKKERVFHYIKQAVDELVEQGQFDTGDSFRLTQSEALHAYAHDLNNDELSLDEKLTGFFEIPTGIGKTALFLSIIGKAYRTAKANDEEFNSVVVVPLNQLLNDTRDEDAKYFIPDLMKDIGLYGDGHHTLGKPITLMTYPAFDKLTKEGAIGPDNVDLLITDESHRGTSDNMVEDVLKIYENTHTAMLGFTASAEFDAAKSVFNTHKRKIYGKKIGQAIKEGDQLAEYIQTQNYVIRVEPQELSELQEIFGRVALDDSNYKTRLKQAAWNKAMVRVLREGRDEHTKDPLTDNQGAFYTQDTAQADALAKMLNADVVLQQRAAAQGYKGVAIAIHSNLKSDEGKALSKRARRRMVEDYKGNEEKGIPPKYMMLVGDEMFKEGFNHPPMKTVFDYQRGSLVDKVQVLGRGARRWFNKKKNRSEGLTFIDSIIYLGSDNKEEEDKNEANAWRSAVTAREVMNGEAYAFSPKAEKGHWDRLQEDISYSRAKVIFPDDENIREYTDLESLETFAARQEEFRKGRFDSYEPISEEDQAFFKSEFRRTGLGGRAIFNRLENPPEGMNEHSANSIVSGKYQRTLPSWIEALKEIYPLLPDDKMQPISKKDLAFLKSEAKRTGLGGEAIFNYIINPPEDMNKRRVKKIISESKKNAPPLWIEKLKEAYALQPDADKELKKEPVSQGDLAFLQSEAERTGISGWSIFGKMDNPLKGMSAGQLRDVMSGRKKKAPPSWIKALKEIYSLQMDEKPMNNNNNTKLLPPEGPGM